VAKDRVERDDEDLVRLYLTDIGQYTLLTKDDEVRLAKAIEAGKEAIEELDAGGKEVSAPRRRELRRTARQGEEAERQFVQSNLRLVVSIAKKYQASGLPLLDLIQEGNLGLEHAVDKFDWRKGFKFSTYATFWIRQAIGRALDQKASLVRLPGDRSASLRAALRQASGDGEELDDENARLYRLTTPTSLDRPVGDDDGSELVDLLAADVPTPEMVLVDREEEQALHDLLGVLDTRARYAVEQRFGLTDGRKRSYREVGEELGVTAEAARRLVKRAVDAVREEALARASAA
jgi:RNA polymerase primary sigma factor